MSYHIAIHEKVLAKGKKYHALPVTCDARESGGEKWFSFSGKQEYYPIVIQDEEKNAMKDLTNVAVTMRVSLDSDTTVLPYEVTAPAMSGTFWFLTFRFHVGGKVKVVFTAKIDDPKRQGIVVTPLEHFITVNGIDDESDKDEEAEGVEKEENEGSRSKSSKSTPATSKKSKKSSTEDSKLDGVEQVAAKKSSKKNIEEEPEGTNRKSSRLGKGTTAGEVQTEMDIQKSIESTAKKTRSSRNIEDADTSHTETKSKSNKTSANTKEPAAAATPALPTTSKKRTRSTITNDEDSSEEGNDRLIYQATQSSTTTSTDDTTRSARKRARTSIETPLEEHNNTNDNKQTKKEAKITSFFKPKESKQSESVAQAEVDDNKSSVEEVTRGKETRSVRTGKQTTSSTPGTSKGKGKDKTKDKEDKVVKIKDEDEKEQQVEDNKHSDESNHTTFIAELDNLSSQELHTFDYIHHQFMKNLPTDIILSTSTDRPTEDEDFTISIEAIEEFINSVQEPTDQKLLAKKNRLEVPVYVKLTQDHEHNDDDENAKHDDIIVNILNPIASGASSQLQAGGKISIEGSVFKLSTPSSLFHYLYRDYSTISPMICTYVNHHQHVHSFTSQSKALDIVKKTFPTALMSPSVFDIFSQLEQRCINHSSVVISNTQYFTPSTTNNGNKTSNAVMTISSLIALLRYLFEVNVEQMQLFYPREKLQWKSLMKKLHQEKVTIAKLFGPYYFLRFIVSMIMDARPFDSDQDAHRDKGKHASHRTKGIMNELEKVLDIALKMIDENAPGWFY